MLGYLVPMLLVIVGSLQLLKRFQMRTGRLPGVMQPASKWNVSKTNVAPRPSGGLLNALIGSFHMNNARQQAGSNIRVIESVPIGGANVHLIEVRGRVLLLGATGSGMRLLAEWQEQQGVESDDFRDLLQAAAADMDALDLNHDAMPATAMVTTLEDLMRETGESVSRRARRLRTVQEVEGEDD